MTEEKTQPSRLLKHSTIYAIGNISRQLVGFIMLPVYTRFLTPADYGVIGLLSFAVVLLEGAFGARLSAAMPKYYYQQADDHAKNSVVSTALIITALVSLITSLVIFYFRDAGSSVLFGSDQFSLAVGLYGFQLLISAIEGYGLTYIRILQKPLLFITFNLGKLVVQLTLNIWFVVYLKMGVMGVVYSSVSSSLLFASIIGIYTIVHTGIRFNWPLGKQMLIFSWPLWISGMAIFYISSSSRYYIRLFSSLDDVGLFELASKFTAILAMLIWTPFSQSWETERFRIYQQADAKKTFQDVFSAIAPFMALGALSISAFAPTVIKVMSSESFYLAGKIVPILTLGTLFGSFVVFFNFSFLVKEKTGFISRNNLLIALVVTILYLLFTPQFGFTGAAVALSLAQIIQFFWVYHSAKKSYDMGISLSDFIVLASVVGVSGILIGCMDWSENLFIDLAARVLLWAIAILVAYKTSQSAHSAINTSIRYLKIRLHVRTE